MAWHYRYVQIEDDLAVADSGTKTFDIDIDDPITALILRFHADNGGAQVPAWTPEMAISKIEIIDGGTVYWSLSGVQNVAQACFALGRWPHQWYDERANNPQRINAPLVFGQYVGDDQFAFTPRFLTNPQLRVTWTDTALLLDNSLQIGITAQVMEGLPPPRSALMWKEIESWTTAASGVHKSELPTDYVYRMMMLRPYLAHNVWYTIWSNLRLEYDYGKLIPFDLNQHEFRDLVKQDFGPYEVGMHWMLTNGEEVELPMGETIFARGSVPSFGYPCGLYTAGAWGYMLAYLNDHAGVPVTDQIVEGNIFGYFPHKCVPFVFGNSWDPSTWFDPKQYQHVDLKLTEAVASAAGSVCLQQVRPLP